MKRNIVVYVDMDGVLADFDAHYEACFGVRPSKLRDDVDWALVRGKKDFFRNIPPMPDMQELWDGLRPFHPAVLTGVPKDVVEAPSNKRRWIEQHVGYSVPVVTTRSSKKWQFSGPGHVLIDDWEKYRELWTDAGGHWITHISAKTSLKELNDFASTLTR